MPNKNDQYYIKTAFSKTPALVTSFNGELINLKGKALAKEVPGDKNGPPTILEVRAATQEDLAKLYEDPKTYGDFSRIIGKKVDLVEVAAKTAKPA